MNKFIKMFNVIFAKDNIRDYIVLILVIAYTSFIGHQLFIKGKNIPPEFFGLVTLAIGYYFKK